MVHQQQPRLPGLSLVVGSDERPVLIRASLLVSEGIVTLPIRGGEDFGDCLELESVQRRRLESGWQKTFLLTSPSTVAARVVPPVFYMKDRVCYRV